MANRRDEVRYYATFEEAEPAIRNSGSLLKTSLNQSCGHLSQSPKSTQSHRLLTTTTPMLAAGVKVVRALDHAASANAGSARGGSAR